MAAPGKRARRGEGLRQRAQRTWITHRAKLTARMLPENCTVVRSSCWSSHDHPSSTIIHLLFSMMNEIVTVHHVKHSSTMNCWLDHHIAQAPSSSPNLIPVDLSSSSWIQNCCHRWTCIVRPNSKTFKLLSPLNLHRPSRLGYFLRITWTKWPSISRPGTSCETNISNIFLSFPN